jgi:hypothetical protein
MQRCVLPPSSGRYILESCRLHGLTVFENTVLRSILGPRKVVITGGWRKLHKEELHNLYYWDDQMNEGEV